MVVLSFRRPVPAQRQTRRARVVEFSTLDYPDRLEIRGESFHCAELQQLQRVRDRWVAHLVREPDNPYDRNAIAVHIHGQIVGHVAREQAAEIAPVLDRLGGDGAAVVFRAVLCGGSPDKPNVGVFSED